MADPIPHHLKSRSVTVPNISAGSVLEVFETVDVHHASIISD
ncbi:uncharacterized protein METZ01_LOCUS443696 [marine metagenome]|uniref:Uncharacterized protein n=1 Tax=marine metagenome TaxID=408172 RepID=A0A382Z5T3_9ZZZZ